MDKKYNHNRYEEKIYKLWEESGAFAPKKKGKPYTILMPPPNANASLHAGHAMYTIDDILIRWKRMAGYSSLWLPGMDHAGFETQYVYEKKLGEKGQSRLDFDRETLYKNIFKFVQDNSGLIYKQFKRLGFSADWNRSVFTLDDNVIEKITNTFSKMESGGFVYRGNYIVNYCTSCGTSLAELETKHKEKTAPLFYVRYKFADGDNHITVATTRPEPIFVDTHLAVHPKDKKNKKLIGKKVLNPLTDEEMEIIADDFVDPDFGTGIVKLTPAHDKNDYQVALKHKLPIIPAFGLDGVILKTGGELAGLDIKTARKKAVDVLKARNLIERIDIKYSHSVATCYRCGTTIEPTVVPNWFIKVDKLKAKVMDVVKKDEVKFIPKRFKKQMMQWLDIMHDWPISRQIVWGIRIPAWYDIKKNVGIEVVFLHNGNTIKGKSGKLLKKYTISQIEKGLQAISAPQKASYKIATSKPGKNYLQETDTFDTWFSSGQWPLVTIEKEEFETRFPTDVLATLEDILRFWVSRMILFALYDKSKIPFKDVYLWSMVADKNGKKMSKSKGNVINPVDLVDKYGADAVRMAVVYGVAPGAKVVLSEDKVRGMRNFANKIWNIARFINIMSGNCKIKVPTYSPTSKMKLKKEDEVILKKLKETIDRVDLSLDKYRFADAADAIYHFIWHELADKYIELAKNREDKSVALSVLRYCFTNSVKLLHPFMPFVTEAVWENIPGKAKVLLISAAWPGKS